MSAERPNFSRARPSNARMRAHALALLVLSCGCKTTASGPPAPPQLVTELYEAGPPADAGAPVEDTNVVVTLTRSVCYGTCPDYTVTLRGDGSVEYVGRQFVGKRGRATDKVPPADVLALVRKLDAAGFDRLAVPTPCPKGIATDNPTHTLTLERGGRAHTVEHYMGNLCAPPVLVELEDAVDAAAKTQRWTSCAPQKWCER